MAVDLRDHNRLTLLTGGREYFPALESAIAAAREEIYLETYIFADDDAGRRVASALGAAASRGVRTHVLVDGFGSKRFFGALEQALADAGVRVMIYRPDVTPWNFRHTRLRRLHRKIAVIDAAVAFVGGINVIDDMNTPGHTPPRQDYAVRIEGPVVRDVHVEARELWKLVNWSQFRRLEDTAVARGDMRPKGWQRAAFVVRDNFRHRSDIEDAYLEAIGAAREEILLACAYFFPGRRFRHALTEAARRGVRVVLLLQGRVEYVLLHYASRALYGMFLDAGVEIREYRKSFLHAKVAVVDGGWATVGSSNIDPFSLLLAREANVVVHDRRFAQELREGLLGRLEEGAEAVSRPRWRKKPWSMRVRIWIAYGISRFLIGWFGYADRH